MADDDRSLYLTTDATPTTTEAVPESSTSSPRSTSSRRSRSRTPVPKVEPKPETKPEPKPEPVKKAWEKWAAEKRTPEVDKRRAPPFNGWAAGKHVTEAEFDAGVHAAANCLIRCR